MDLFCKWERERWSLRWLLLIPHDMLVNKISKKYIAYVFLEVRLKYLKV
jgi:hypothetical protein